MHAAALTSIKQGHDGADEATLHSVSCSVHDLPTSGVYCRLPNSVEVDYKVSQQACIVKCQPRVKSNHLCAETSITTPPRLRHMRLRLMHMPAHNFSLVVWCTAPGATRSRCIAAGPTPEVSRRDCRPFLGLPVALTHQHRAQAQLTNTNCGDEPPKHHPSVPVFVGVNEPPFVHPTSAACIAGGSVKTDSSARDWQSQTQDSCTTRFPTGGHLSSNAAARVPGMSLLRQQTGSDLPRLLNRLAQQLTQVLDCAERKVEDAKHQPGQTFKYLGPFQVCTLGSIHGLYCLPCHGLLRYRTPTGMIPDNGVACMQSEIYLPQIPDYEIWVPYPQWISLDKIRKRIKGKGDCLYTQASDLISDVHQMQLNAEVGAPRDTALMCSGIYACAEIAAAYRAITPQATAKSATQVTQANLSRD